MTEASRTKTKQCAGVRKDGQPCQAQVLGVSAYCFTHDPDKAAERAEARSKGGQNRAGAARLRGLVPPRLLSVYDRLEKALTEVHEGKLEPRQASAMAALARAMVAVLTSGELEERVRKLEARDG